MAGIHAVVDTLDHASFTSGIPALEDNYNFESFMNYPPLEPDQFGLQALEFIFIIFTPHLDAFFLRFGFLLCLLIAVLLDYFAFGRFNYGDTLVYHACLLICQRIPS